MWRRLLTVAAMAAGVFLLATDASAQFMYLDANSDGISTDADRLNLNGVPTNVDVYLITDQNADGSTAVCNNEGGPLSINFYIVKLHANGGTVVYSNVINRQASMTWVFSPFQSNGEDMAVGYGGATSLPPGKYKLMSLVITGASGNAAVAIVPDNTFVPYDPTQFGTLCYGNDFDNMYKLVGTAAGTGDWSDVAGLGTQSGQNRQPVLTAPLSMSGQEGLALTVSALSANMSETPSP